MNSVQYTAAAFGNKPDGSTTWGDGATLNTFVLLTTGELIALPPLILTSLVHSRSAFPNYGSNLEKHNFADIDELHRATVLLCGATRRMKK